MEINLKYLKEIKELYKERKDKILKRLLEFKKNFNKDENFIFGELCFCILTPQSKAEQADLSIKKLKENNLLFNGSINDIKPFLKGVRFYNKKAEYIIKARDFFKKNGIIRIKDKINKEDIKKTREYLIKNIKGIGYKEASHFLRNIGFFDFAILDRHILDILKKLNVIKINGSLSKKKYLEIEEKFREFSNKIKIPMAHLDLLFWSIKTNKIFK